LSKIAPEAAVSSDEYLLDNRVSEAGERIAALSALFDPITFRHVDALGVGPGWRCWEVGAGGPSVQWGLAARVGPDGRVLATDIDVAWAAAAAGGPIEVRRHDVARDAPPDELFDLVHARLVLVHLSDRERALRSMIGALRPGGWLLVEDADPALQPLSVLDPVTAEDALGNKLRTGFRALLAERGVDLAYGRKLPRLLRAAGLREVAADAYFPVTLPACAPLELATVRFLRERLLEKGLATTAEIDQHLANVAAGRLDLAQPPMISAWGRRHPL
jgi:SAM-dependent methyltransferase